MIRNIGLFRWTTHTLVPRAVVLVVVITTVMDRITTIISISAIPAKANQIDDKKYEIEIKHGPIQMLYFMESLAR